MDAYNYITDKIQSLKSKYPSLRNKPDYYVFSLLCVKANFYKNPALILYEEDFGNIVVDSTNDGGADILLSDPTSETADLVIGQSKFCKNISFEEVRNALNKMATFYKEMIAGHYEQFNERVVNRFVTLYSELGEDSKIHFAFYASASKNRISKERLEKTFRQQFTTSDDIKVSIFFADDIAEEVHEAESVKRIIEDEKIRIDEANNYLLYGDSAAIVNVSAFSIKQLYVKHNTNLLSLNLRYHITGGNVDKEIRETIKNDPNSFWLKNNGLTIICDDFKIDGTEVRLWNFSIINGGQTTYILSKSNITALRDLWLPCKIIKTAGATADEKIAFSLVIAKAANAQKAIKPSDLKANSPEQQRFAQAMREVEIFYQTKRGEKPDKRYRDEAYRQTKLLDVGKLCLAAIFQEPCKSRSKPSSVYSPKYYELIFNSNQKQIAALCKELLYMDYYFSKKYLIEFDRDNKDMPEASLRTTFAHTARTICIAFTALAARRYQGNITDSDLTILTSANSDSAAYKILCNLGEMKCFLPMELYTDSYNTTLDRLFTAIIE